MEDVLASIDPRLCVACKGARALCGIDPCPLLARIRSHMPSTPVTGDTLWGTSPPSLFVGRHGYPRVGIGPMLPPEKRAPHDARRLDSPADWMDLSIPDIVGLRSSLVRTVHNVKVNLAHGGADIWSRDRIVAASQELAVAARPVDAEVRLDRGVRFGDVRLGEFAAPHGPTAGLRSAQLAENVRVERTVERAVCDTDLMATEALRTLHAAGTDVMQMERILSAGLLGRARTRRLVPTRWSITATDDQVGRGLLESLLDRPALDTIEVYDEERFGNRFVVLMWPRSWAFESVEAWMKGNFWTQGRAPVAPIVETDHEDHRKRKTYAATAGGYYATRLAVLEHLHHRRRQAGVLVVREITDAYTAPLGVWVVREVARAALARKPLVFGDIASATRHLDRRLRLASWRAHATAFARFACEPRLDDFA